MASQNTTSIKIHDQCNISPPPPSSPVFLPLTFFDVYWLRHHPFECTFFYPLNSPPSFFFQKVVPNLKTSLSFTFRHFLPLAGNLVWPSDSDKPFVQYNPGDGVSLVIAESDADFDAICKNSSFRDASESRSFVPHLESWNSHASVMSLQITLFPNRGFSIGITTHHAVLDGKSSTLFLKAWASLCCQIDEKELSPTLAPELKPFLNREVMKDPKDYGILVTDDWTAFFTKNFPHDNTDGICLKILPSEPKVEDSVRATFVLTREDLEKVKKKVLSKWDTVDDEESSKVNKPPPSSTLSSFVLTVSYLSVCMSKAIRGCDEKREKFALVFTVDCRNRLEPPLPDSYFGNCLAGLIIDSRPKDLIKENGVVLVAKSVHNKIKALNGKGAFDGGEQTLEKIMALVREGIEIIGVAWSNKFGVYGIDFGLGKPSKVEIESVDRGLSIGLAENSDVEKGGVQIGLVLNKNVMDLFRDLFHSGLNEED